MPNEPTPDENDEACPMDLPEQNDGIVIGVDIKDGTLVQEDYRKPKW